MDEQVVRILSEYFGFDLSKESEEFKETFKALYELREGWITEHDFYNSMKRIFKK